MRQELIEAVEELAAPSRVPPSPAGVNWILEDYLLLYEDANLAEAPAEAIGVTLLDEEEAQALNRLAVALGHLISDAGSSASESTFMDASSWPNVVEAARAALPVLGEPPSTDSA
jgi:hypothetical protein